jgi:hypothetical protein
LPTLGSQRADPVLVRGSGHENQDGRAKHRIGEEVRGWLGSGFEGVGNLTIKVR